MPNNHTEALFTHFTSGNAALPDEYYVQMGRALHRWSQLESSVGTLAASIMRIPFLEALQRLRGGGGFKTKNIFVQLSAATAKKGQDVEALAAIAQAEKLYEKRRVLFHSVWGHVSGVGSAAVGIQEWSSADYANFRAIGLGEIVEFATACLAGSEQLMKHVIPIFHGTSSFIVDDDNGLPRGNDVSLGTK